VIFWLFTRALLDDAFALRWWHALVWAAVAVFSFVNCMWIALAAAGNLRISMVAINLLALGFIALAVARPLPHGRLIWSRAAAASGYSLFAQPRFTAA
jgi:hypothetical protein